MAQQTATEWLCMQLLDLDNHKIWPSLLQRAKNMEKEQIIIARWNGDYFCDSIKAEQYYNETYNK